MRSFSCSLQLRRKSNGDKTLKWTFGYYNFFNSSDRDFHSSKCSFHSSFDLSGLAQQTPQHDKQITVIRLHSSGTFARTLILRKPLAFIGRTLKKYVKNSLKYRTFMKTRFIVFSSRLMDLFLMSVHL